MARIRTIKPDFWTDEKVVELSPWARLLFIGLWSFCDDEGRMVCSPKKIKMQIFPADSVECIELLNELQRNSLIHIYVVENIEYLQVIGFVKHQVVNRKTPSKFPPPHGCFMEDSLPEGNGIGMEKECNTLSPVSDETRLESEIKGSAVKENGEEKKQNTRIERFEEFWKIYPARNEKKVGKTEAKGFFLSTKIKDEEVSLILQAARNYAVSKAVTDGFAKDAIRFLRKDFWKDWVEPENTKKGGDSDRYSFLQGNK